MLAGGASLEPRTADVQGGTEEDAHEEQGAADPPAEPRGAVSPRATLHPKSLLYPQRSFDPTESRRYFVARPGAFDQAMEDLKSHVVANMGEAAHSFWLLTEIDHWNNERERIVVITDSALLICKYDFITLRCRELQRVPLSYIEQISMGTFTFPERSLERRDGEGLRIFWDKQREPSFLSRWNPWATDMPYTTFMEHPIKDGCQRLSTICQMASFKTQLVQAVQRAQQKDLVPGRHRGLLVVSEPIPILVYAGLTSFLGNRNKLGYSLARGSVGF